MSLKDLKDVTYYDLNNEINIPKDDKIQLNKDKEALEAFIKENVEPNLKKFGSLKEKFEFLIDNDYLEENVVVNSYLVS